MHISVRIILATACYTFIESTDNAFSFYKKHVVGSVQFVKIITHANAKDVLDGKIPHGSPSWE